jgi:hypothetical protein
VSDWRAEHGGGDAAPQQDDAPPVAAGPGPADPRVVAAVARLDGLGDTPPAEHVEVYEDVHRVLQDALADAARGPEPARQGQPADPGP